MTTEVLIGTPLETDPYLELLLRSGAGDPGTELGIFSKLAAMPTRMKASRSNEKLALVTNLVADETVGLGTTPGETTTPTGGIRVFNWNDRFIFFGANSVRDPVMFERTGLFYRDTETADLAAAPNTYVSAAFSQGGRYFITAKGSSADILLYEWTGSSADDPAGDWNDLAPVTAPATITAFAVSPDNSYFVAQTSTPQFKFFDIDAGAWIGSWTNGTFLDWKPDESEFIYAPSVNANDVIVAHLVGTTVTTLATLPSSGGSLRRGRYSPDGVVVAITGRPTSGTEAPRFYSKVSGTWTYASGLAKANAASLNVIDFAFDPDGRLAIASSDSGAARVELFDRGTITPEPFTPDSTSPIAGTAAGSTVVRSGDGLVILTQTQVWRYDAGTNTYTNVTPSGWTTTTRVGQSSNDDGSIIMAVSTTTCVVYTWNGTAYVSATAPGSLPSTMRTCALSPTGAHALVLGVVTTTASVRFYTRNMGTGAWTANELLTYPVTSGFVVSQANFCPGREDLAMAVTQSALPRTFKSTSSVWAVLETAPTISGFTFGQSAGWHPGGHYLAYSVRDASLNWRLVVSFLDAGDLMTIAYSSASNIVNAGTILSVKYSVDGAYLLFLHGGTPYLFATAGVAYTPHTLSGFSGTFINGIWDTEHLILFTTTTSPKWIYDMSGVIQTYVLETTFALTGTTAPTYVTFSPDGDIIHYGRNGDSHHKLSATPYSDLSVLSFCEYAPSVVHTVQYSPTGKAVLFTGPNGPEVAVRPNLGSTFVNSRNIEGCFVFLYDLEGNNFIERSWAQHPWGSAIKDINFSHNEEVMSYHVILPVGAPGDATRGRLIWDVSEPLGVKRFEFRGQIWEAAMSNSFIAFSPWNTHFVVTHEHLVANDHFISLHEFGVNYTYVTQDSKLVEFGPPDFSKCDDVVVAHGGTVPLTFFKHDDTANILIPRPVDIIDWDADTVVLDVAFSDDCEGLVVLTPDEIIPLEPEGEDELKPEPPTELEEEVDPEDPDRPTIDLDPDWDIHVKPGKWNPTYPETYHWDPNDPENPVYSIAYVPYSACTVTFRVKSIPS